MYGRLSRSTKQQVLIAACLSIALVWFSFTQVDLNFTFSRNSYLQNLVRDIQWWGYYARPWAISFYLVLLAGWFGFYAFILDQSKSGKISKKSFWLMIGVTTGLIVWSYPAFSYDIFNYLFTAKTVILYQKNPYELIPQSLMGFDPWISVMRWIHQPSAYTPVWIFFSLPVYILSQGLLIPAIYLLKLFLAAGYLFTVWLIGKIANKYGENEILAMSSFALNPLVIIETLVSGHNDILMAMLAILAVYYMAFGRKWLAWFWLSVSVATKLVTIALLPVFFVFSRKRALWAMAVILGIIILKREFLPWYWVWIMPFIAIIANDDRYVIAAFAMSVGLLLRYAPYLYFGNWDPPVSEWMNWLTIVPLLIGGLWLTRYNKKL